MIATAPRVGRLAPTAVNAILADVRRVQATGKSVVSLMRGEPDFPTPTHIADAAVAALRAGRTGYPDNRGELKFREAVADKLAREQQGRYDPATEILATTGATLGLYCALTARARPTATRCCCPIRSTTPTARRSRWPAACRGSCGRRSSAAASR